MDSIYLLALRKTTARWRAEDALVAADANGVNLFRLRLMWPVSVAFNGVFLIGFLWRLLDRSLTPAVAQWNQRLIWIHIFIVVASLAIGWLVGRASGVRHTSATRWLIVGSAVFIMLASILLVAADQAITPNITPYLIACLLVGGECCLPSSSGGGACLRSCICRLFQGDGLDPGAARASAVQPS